MSESLSRYFGIMSADSKMKSGGCGAVRMRIRVSQPSRKLARVLYCVQLLTQL